MRKYKDEIIRWANSPEGTETWIRDNHRPHLNWVRAKPCWLCSNTYIVDDEWATLRKAQVDGKQLQYLDGVGDIGKATWIDSVILYTDIRDTEPKYWRIKPDGPVYEWQWTYYNDCKDEWSITNYLTEEGIKLFQNEDITYFKFEPSKRERK